VSRGSVCLYINLHIHVYVYIFRYSHICIHIHTERCKKDGVEVRGCPATVKALQCRAIEKEADWATEYSDKIAACKVVNDVEEAIQHINRYVWSNMYLSLSLSVCVRVCVLFIYIYIHKYIPNRFGSRHTDVIVTEDAKVAAHFQSQVDAAGVYWNCSRY
jgi:glutamate-5-semialdehyde dehydrogenase